MTGSGSLSVEGPPVARRESTLVPGLPDPTEEAAPMKKAPEPKLPFGEVSCSGKYGDVIRAACLDHGSQDALEAVLTPAKVVALCDDVTAVLGEKPSLIDIDVSGDEKLVVVGDVHGQLQDLTRSVMPHINEKGDKAKVLFLGDYVDRGPQSVEVLMLLLALKVDFPDRVTLLRGNHEDATTSKIYGFFSESLAKFKTEGANMWGLFNQVFCHLPVAARVTCTPADGPPKRFAAMHGGLSPDLRDLSVVGPIDRTDYGSMLDNVATNIVDGLLWSDPTDVTQRFLLNERGCGYLFGNLATSDFCEENGLEFLCRAHQMTMAGYAWTHDDKCLTVFSSPNYCGMSGNLGAVMIVDSAFQTEFHQFEAVNMDPPRAMPTAVPYFSALFGGTMPMGGEGE